MKSVLEEGFVPKVSIVIPAYQAEDFLKNAIDSVLGQTFGDYEVIVVDDGSTDSTRKILKSYACRIRYLAGKHEGPSSARNRGIRASRGEYVAFLDSDDLWLPNKLALQVAVLNTNSEIGLVFCDAEYAAEGKLLGTTLFMSRKKPHSGKVLRQLIKRNFIGTSTVIVRKKCFDAVGLFDESLALSEDHDMWIRIAREFEIYCIDEPLVVVRVREKSVSKNEIRLQEANLAVLEKTLKEDSSLLMDRDLLDKAYYPLIKRLGFLYLKKGDNQKARGFFQKYTASKRQELSVRMLAAASYLPAQFVVYLWATLKAMSKNRFLSPIRYKLYSSLSDYDYNWVVFSDRIH